MSTKRVVVPLAPGFEEIEAVTIIDVLRRADIEVLTTALDPGPVRGAHGITVVADLDIDNLPESEFDMVILPGGLPGAEHLTNDRQVQTLLRRTINGGGRVAAICAAPMAFEPSGLAAERTTTCYPGFEGRFEQMKHVENSVVVDGPLVTSRGPGTALDFAIELVSLLKGEEKAAELAKGMLVTRAEDTLRL